MQVQKIVLAHRDHKRLDTDNDGATQEVDKQRITKHVLHEYTTPANGATITKEELWKVSQDLV